jgi:hypothetical protein
MEKTESYSIELNLYNGKNPFELNKFYSISFDTSKINLSTKQTEKLVDQFYKEMNIKRKDELMDDLFLTLIHKQFPNFPANTLFVQDIEKIDLDLKLSYDYDKIALGDNLVGFLNLDFYKFEDFFKFFCTFIFRYFSKIPKKQLNKIFKGFDENIIYIDSERPTHIVEKSLLKECAKQLYESEKCYLIEKQKLFRNFVDYIFNNHKEKRLSKLTNSQRFYIFQNISEEIKNLANDYICDYTLGFWFNDPTFKSNILNKTKETLSDPLSNEDFLIDNMLKNDPDGKKIIGHKYSFETNNLFTYFYIILYHITLNNVEYIKKCQVCGKYFFSDKNNTLYCNGKYSKDITCKEYGIKTSQKRKENEEPVYGKYRQIYAKKAMMVKRNPDIEYYKTNYEKWKKEAKQFISDIKAGKKTYDEFDKWLTENS